MKRLRIIAVVSMVLSIMAASCKKQEEEVGTPDWYYDVLRIQSDMSSYSSMRFLYDPAPFEELKQDILDGKVDRMEAIYRIKKIQSGYHVAHLGLNAKQEEKEDYLAAPFAALLFGDGYHISTAAKKYSKYLGWKITEINGLPVKEALDKLSQYMPYETESGKNYLLEYPLYYYHLKFAGLLNHDKISFTLQSPDGTVVKKAFKLIDTRKTKFERLAPEADNVWNYMRDHGYYSVKAVPEKKTVYIPFNKTEFEENYPLSQLVSDMMNELHTNSYDTIVFDVRYNPGGNGYVIDEFRKLFKENLDELLKYNIAVIITGRTYSAGCWFLNLCMELFPDVKIFGGETGESVFNYTNGFNYELTKLNCIFIFPIWEDNLEQIKTRSDDPYRGTMPDIEVQENFDDLINGEDSIYNAIYDYFN